MWRASLLLLCAARVAIAADPRDARAFDEIVAQVQPGERAAAAARMQRWVDAHPGTPQAARGLVWMAQLHRADGRSAEARALLERAAGEAPASEWALHARKGLADLDLEAHRYGRAIAGYDALAREPSALWRYVGKNAADNARGERLRFGLVLACIAAMALLALLRLSRTGFGALWPLPLELVAALPVLALLALAARAQERPEAGAVLTLALGGALLLWLNGAWLRAARGSGAARAVDAALGAGQAVALLYCAMVLNGLWGKLVDTIAMGAE